MSNSSSLAFSSTQPVLILSISSIPAVVPPKRITVRTTTTKTVARSADLDSPLFEHESNKNSHNKANNGADGECHEKHSNSFEEAGKLCAGAMKLLACLEHDDTDSIVQKRLAEYDCV
ncbi:hypothetical protein OGATHE_003153 [Ogataea polymorpha]|uniref:Uncharacterized protein n=1 Tax=Ogataea polymorpha TaxID=460523 RepID=A0A9P8P9T3_9ASCO|nr:hypothetical protein OGATHE_003153 [Ogataea polymorpha]